MRRFGWLLIGVGLVVAVTIGFNFILACYVDPDRNDPVLGFFSMAGIWAGLITAGIGAVNVARSRGFPTPPL